MAPLKMMSFVLVTAAVVSFSSSVNAITLGQVDDFQDGTTQNWGASGSNPNPPANQANAGPSGAGDFALAISSNGNSTGSGSRLLGFNNSQWTGDYLAAGVSSINVDLSSPNNVPLNVRFALRGAGGTFVTPDVIVPAGTGVWNNYTFSLDPDDLLASGGTDASATLGGVTQLRLLHNPNVSDRGATVGAAAPFAATLLADNIAAVPEPATLAMLSLGGLMMAARRRR